MIWLALLLGIGIVLSLVWSWGEGDTPINILAVLLTFMFCGVVFDAAKKNKNPDEPTAIDVYRGKTTLKVIYIDSIAIDTVVVFKEDIK